MLWVLFLSLQLMGFRFCGETGKRCGDEGGIGF